MGYADKTYYKEKYHGTILLEDTTDVQLDRASDQIDTLTYNRIVGRGFDNLTAYQQDQIQKAVCAHADFIEKYGAYFSSPLSGFSAGSISVSFDAGAVVSHNGVKTSSEAYGYLQKSGLATRRL